MCQPRDMSELSDDQRRGLYCLCGPGRGQRTRLPRNTSAKNTWNQLKRVVFFVFFQLNRAASLSDYIQPRQMMIMRSTASLMFAGWILSWWYKSRDGCTPNGLQGHFFSCLPGLIYQITCLPSVTDTFWRNIWAENKSTWASQPLCHHAHRVCLIDAVPGGRSFMFCTNMVARFLKDVILLRNSALKYVSETILAEK